MSTRYGSLVNTLADQGGSVVEAEVGMGGTVYYWSDRQAVTVVEVNRNGREVVTRDDTARRVDGNGMSDAQRYEFERNENGTRHVFTRRKDGSFRMKGGQTLLRLGRRDHYFDFSF